MLETIRIYSLTIFSQWPLRSSICCNPTNSRLFLRTLRWGIFIYEMRDYVNDMTSMTRRSIIQSGSALALTAILAGCADDSGGVVKASSNIPGVEDGEISDNHTFANAHSDQLATRSGTVEWLKISLDRETGDAEKHTLYNVRVDGGQVHAVISGRNMIAAPEKDRQEVYFEGNTVAIRTRTDGKWDAVSVERQKASLSKGSLTGKSQLESASMSKVGTETVDGEELYWFSDAGRNKRDEHSKWSKTHALVDARGLVHNFQKAFDDGERNNRASQEWIISDLGETSVERPDWVDDAEE